MMGYFIFVFTCGYLSGVPSAVPVSAHLQYDHFHLSPVPIFQVSLQLCQTVLICNMTAFLSGDEDKKEEAILYGIVIVTAAILDVIPNKLALYKCEITLARIRTACSGLIYRQVERMTAVPQ